MYVSTVLKSMLDDAKKHLKGLKKYYASLGIEWGSFECNPMTDVLEILEELEII